MDYVADPNELIRRLRAYAFTTAPEELAGRLQSLPGVPADQICDGAETLYAYRDQLDDAALRICGELFTYAEQQGWATFNRGDRTRRIVACLRRDLGEKGAGVARKDDEWPEPEANRRDGFDWRAPADDAPAASPIASA